MFSRLLLTLTACGSLAACASAISTPNQSIAVITPGAEDARCVLSTQHARFVAYPPKAITIRRMQEPLKVTCTAPGNRERTVVVHPVVNKMAAGNVVTAGVGAAYDHVSGALYQYPSPVMVDFTGTRASQRALPSYHNPDTVSPFDQVNEDMRDAATAHPEEQGLAKQAPVKKKNLISKEEQNLKEYKSDIVRPY